MTAKGLRAFQRAAKLPGHRGAGASNARRARRARPTARRAARARPGHVRLGRLVAPVPPRPGGAPPAARRRRSLRRVDEGGARPLPAHSPARGRRDRRPGDADGLRARSARRRCWRSRRRRPVDDQLRRQAGDTLTEIAAKHKTTVRALAAANDLESVNLVVEGAKLRLPGVGRVRSGGRAQPLDRSRAHRQVGGALRHLRQPRARARVAGVRLPDERDLVDRRLGADADHARHLGVRRDRPPRPHRPEDGRGRGRGRDDAARTTCSSASTATSGWRSPPGTRVRRPCASTGSTTRRRCSSRTCSR